MDGAEILKAGDVTTPQFKEWFGDSKVVDSAGKPLVVYHGTTADFTSFQRGAVSIFRYGDGQDSGGIFFSSSSISMASTASIGGNSLLQCGHLLI